MSASNIPNIQRSHSNAIRAVITIWLSRAPQITPAISLLFWRTHATSCARLLPPKHNSGMHKNVQTWISHISIFPGRCIKSIELGSILFKHVEDARAFKSDIRYLVCKSGRAASMKMKPLFDMRKKHVVEEVEIQRVKVDDWWNGELIPIETDKRDSKLTQKLSYKPVMVQEEICLKVLKQYPVGYSAASVFVFLCGCLYTIRFVLDFVKHTMSI